MNVLNESEQIENIKNGEPCHRIVKAILNWHTEKFKNHNISHKLRKILHIKSVYLKNKISIIQKYN